MIKNIHDLEHMKNQTLGSLGGRVNTDDDEKIYIMTCTDTGCTSSGSLKIMEKLNELVERDGLHDKVHVVKTGCFGLCAEGPVLVIHPGNIMYTQVTLDDVDAIWESHVKNNIIVHRLTSENEQSFFGKQMRIALRNCGRINPEDIKEYIAYDGYKALAKALTEMEPGGVIQCLKDSGLRGRGGGGFPTGTKWEFAAKQQNKVKYVCCNADEGDPGAFMDRSILEGDPHAVIEAMAIAGYAIGANKGYVYIRAEYPSAVLKLKHAIKQAKEHDLLGESILGTDFDFDIEIRLGAGAFVCGEETALIASIEGNRGEPTLKPPFPAVEGLFGKPTILNNVETFANIPQIILNGPEWFNSIGTESSKGTKVFALGGKINNTGLIEVPMGTTLRDIIYEIGGGIPNDKKFKAAQTGGPSGGCIPAEHLDTPIDYDSLIKLQSMMGSGGMIIMDENTCMVDMAKFYLEFTVDESCGKCPPCRIGTKRMLEILTKITEGNGTLEDIDDLEYLANNIKKGALCGLGQTAPNPVLSTLKYFRDEYVAHVVDKTCPAGVCQALVKYSIDEDMCKHCGVCARNCPVHAIHGSKDRPYVIDEDVCIRCGLCVTKCKFNAVKKD